MLFGRSIRGDYEFLRKVFCNFFSGALIPITLFPGWFQTLSQYLPFQSMVFVPVSIYTGSISGTDAYISVAVQLVWLMASIIIVRLFWMFAVRKVTILGG
ncbi:MAG: ABC-2 family transporter protein [Bacillaceae bacterium]|nr:ABC-2 family transporter protein [Bacillaceae bacterium]